MMISEAYLSAFNPRAIPFQHKVIKDLRSKFDYGLGTHEVLLSGSVGSAKSTLMAHVAVTHCLFNKGARICLARKALPDLKSTIFQEVCEHIGRDLVEGRDYSAHTSTAHVKFSNGSEIISRSWSDKRYKKLRSLRLSGALFEEIVENSEEDMQAYNEMKMRVGRIPQIEEKFILSATNPDSPQHWAYRYFFEDKSPTKHVYLSRTEDNPFLPSSYIEQLKRDLDPKNARRMLYGEWIEISQDVVYYAYDRDRNYVDQEYKVNPTQPIHICWDFNIGLGKPMSCCLFQYIDGIFHVFGEVVIHGARTLDTCDELADRGYLNYPCDYILQGDATGSHKDTRNNLSDWDQIKKFFGAHNSVKWRFDVARSNPPIRKRHNLVNAYCLNTINEVRLKVYNGAPTVDKGLRLTALKKGADYIEDDSKEYQHITTALGYGLVQTLNQENRPLVQSGRR